MKQIFTIFKVFFMLTSLVWMNTSEAQTPQYDNGTINFASGNSIPWSYSSTGVKGQNLYPIGVFGNPPSGMQITNIYIPVYTSSSGTAIYSQLHIGLKQDLITSLSTTYETGMTTVFSSTNHTLNVVGGQWVKIELQNPFPYDPTVPLILEVNQLMSTFLTWYNALSNQGTPTGSYRNYSTSYNASSAAGAGAYMTGFGFDLEPQSTAPNDVGVTLIDSPMVFCDGVKNIVATVKNFGVNQVDSFTVNWTFNGILQTPVVALTLLDTFKGLYPTTAQVVLGSQTFVSNQMDTIVAWTSMPNNQVDTVTKNDSANATRMPSMYGNFTINPAGSGTGNYVKWSDLAKDLSDFGVCGPVHVTVSPGTYNEQVLFNDIKGTSAVNTITFVPDTGGTVTVQYSSSGTTDGYVIKLNKASWMSFTDFILINPSNSYSTCLELNGGSSYNSFTNMTFEGNTIDLSSYNRTIYANSAGNNYNRFENNVINGGYYGIYFYGGGTTSTNIGNEWINNEFNEAYLYGALYYYSTDLKFNHNVMRSGRNYSSMYGLMSYYSYKSAEVIGNDINIPGYMALYLYYHEGNNTEKPLIANNILRIGKNAGTYGYGIYCYGGGFCRIVNNTIVNTHSTGTYYGIYVQGGANTVMNNIIHDRNGYNTSGYASLYYNGGFAVLESDYNDVYTNRALGYLNASYSTLSAWQAATGFDMHSITADPGFTNFDSLRTCSDSLDGAGTPLSYVTDDFDGDGRHPSTPDIGADEWIGNTPGAYSAGPDAFVCEGKTATIGIAVSGGIFNWNTSDTTSTIVVSQEGTYTVSMTSVCGGSFGDTVEVIDLTPVANFTVENSFKTGKFVNTSAKGSSYMWVIHSIPSDTFYSTDVTYIFPDNGPYNVDLYVYNDCDTAVITKEWKGYVGLNENNLANGISVMPNPATDDLTIRFNGLEGDVMMEMTNIQGQLVYSERILNVSGNGSKTIDVTSLNKGMYILKFTSDREITTKQIVVQ